MASAEELMRLYRNDSEWVFVFPSEVAADWALKDLLSGGGARALSRRKSLSWDRFKEETLRAPTGLRPANKIARLLFLEALLEENSRRPFFEAIVNPAYASSSRAAAASLLKILPRLSKIAETERVLAPGKRRDLERLAARYRAFLKEAALYEPDDFLPGFEPRGKKYLVFYPEVIADWEAVSPAWRGSEAVRTCGLADRPGEKPRPLLVYPDLESEINHALLAVHALLESGVSPDRIAITAAGLEELALPLAAAARRLDLKLKINEGRALLAFPGVNLLGQAEAVVSSGFALRSLETLLGNRALPWKNLSEAAALIEFGLKHNCLKNYQADGKPFDLWEHHLRRGPSRLKTLLSFYRGLRSSLAALTASDSFDAVKTAVTKFFAVFFDADGVDEEVDGYVQYALRRLDDLRDQARSLPLPAPASPFRVWIKLLSETHYVPPSRKPGLAVYPYRVSAGIRPAHHFLINLSEEATRTVIRPYPFLSPDEEARLGSADRDLSDAFLALYLSSGEKVRMSFSREGLGRTRLPPPFFLKTGSLSEVLDDGEATDAYREEYEFFLKAAAHPPPALFRLQKEGLAAAAATAPVPPARLFTASAVVDDELAGRLKRRGARMTDEKGAIALTPSDIESFQACPFRFLLEKRVGLNEWESEFAQDERLWYGTLLHRVFETFFRRLAERQGGFERSRLRDYHALFQEAVRETADLWEKEETIPLPPLWALTRENLFPGFAAFLEKTAAAFPSFQIAGVEKTWSAAWEKEAVSLSGKIDLIGKTEDGVILIDYKTRRTPKRSALKPAEGEPTSYQMPCYIILAQENGERAAAAAYYSFENGDYAQVFNPGAEKAFFTEEELASVLAAARRTIMLTAARIRAGDFSLGKHGGQDCSRCTIRPVCRARYFLRI